MTAMQLRLTPFVAGEDAYEALPALARPHGSALMLIGGKRAMEAAGGRLMKALRFSGLRLIDSLVCEPLCTMEGAARLARKAREAGAELLLGMGGGRALDQAKAAAALAGLPVITVPTIAATCAAVSGLSVLYHEDGSFDRFLFLDEPPLSALIHSGVLAEAPACYLKAGIGDSLAKQVEASFSARGAALSYRDRMGLSVADSLLASLLQHGVQALRDNEARLPTQALTEVALASIVSVGYVSLLVQEGLNGALAHSLYYAMEPMLKGLPILHGDFVAWGALCQLQLDGQEGRLGELRGFLAALGTPTSLHGMGLDAADSALLSLARAAVRQPDMALVPYPITGGMIQSAIQAVELLAKEELSLV